MNKNEAMKAMIDGKKIVETTKTFLHYYVFENGNFMYSNAQGMKCRADMPEHNNYQVLVTKKTITVHGFTTPAMIALIKEKGMEKVQMVFVTEKTKFSYCPVRIAYDEVEE